MPRPRTDKYWEDRVRTLATDDETKAAARIAIELEQEAARLSRADSPSVSTVRRILARFPESERQQFRPAAWPESFGSSELPWESSGHFFELWRYLGRRPSVRLVRAFWQASLAAGSDTKVGVRHRLASRLLHYDPRTIEDVILRRDYEGLNPTVGTTIGDMRSGAAVTRFENVQGEYTTEEQKRLEESLANLADYLEWKESQSE